MTTAKPPSSFRTLQRPQVFYWHYAWVIVSIIAVMQMVGSSVRMAFGVFIDPLSTEFGWSQGAITMAYALSSVVTAVASPMAGSLGDRIGARKAMMIGCTLFIVGVMLTGVINQVWQLYVTFGLMLGVAQAIFLVPLIPSAMTWFRRHLGLGMGILMAAWGLGPALATPLLGYMIEAFGWKDTFWITAVVSAFIMAGLIAVYKNKPSDHGVDPYGFVPGDPDIGSKRPPAERVKQFTGYMRRTAAYWNLSSIHFLGCVGHAIILIYIIPIAVNEGISLVVAASLVTAMSAVSIITRLATPVMCDKYGPKMVMTVAYLIQGLTVIMLFWTHDVWLFFAFAAAFGIGYGGEAGGFPILNRRYYGFAPVGSAHGFQMLGAGLGMALGGWIGGVIFDMMGNYDWALIISVVASVAGAVSILLLEPTNRLLIPDWEKEQVLEDESQPSAGKVGAPTSAGAD